MKKTCRRWDQMPRECSVCSHPEAFAINEVLVLQKASNRRIAPQYGLSEKAIRRHREHIPQLLVKAAEAMELDDAEHLAAELNKLKQDVHRLKDRAEGEGDLRTALLGCDKALKALELQAKQGRPAYPGRGLYHRQYRADRAP